MFTMYVYVLDTLADWETAPVMAELSSRRFFRKGAPEVAVKTAGISREPVRTMGGLTIIPDCVLDDIAPDDRTLLLLPGADRWAEPEHAAAIGKAGDLLSCGGIVCAICGATVALAHAGMLNDRPHTSNGRGFLESFCPNYTGQHLYVDEPAVADGKLITAAATGALPFARKIIEKLGVFSPETLEAWYAYFSSGRPEHFFALMQSVQ